jgi:SulP family sulfate permease
MPSKTPPSSSTFEKLSFSTETSSVFTDVLYGCINTLMVIPVSISFCSIIFRDAAFAPYLPFLVKLVLFSSAIHQICFSLFSSLPFAVGQVQDAGLIFLSTMAASVVQGITSSAVEAGISDRSSLDEVIVPTTLFTLAVCTFLLGGMLMVVAKLKLASMVQYLPMPVVGGYLAFIGFFCGLAGLSLMSGHQVTSITQLPVLCNQKSLFLLFPGIIIGIVTYLALIKLRSPWVLPSSLLFTISTFYSVMWLTGSSFQQARESGWIAPLVEVGKKATFSVVIGFVNMFFVFCFISDRFLIGSPFEAWSYYDVMKVEWSYIPTQIPTLIAMFLVVAFSSSLDVAAIEMELGTPLDYNRT